MGKSLQARKGSRRGHRSKRRWSLRSWPVLLGIILVASAYVGIFYYFFVGPFSFRWKAMYGETIYPEGYHVRGIDISHYQTFIDWERLRNASMNNDPIRFVIVKATEGTSLMDDNFNENFYEAKRNDFVRGAYHFFVPGMDAQKQAKFFLRQVHLEPGDLPPVLDVEKMGSLTAAQLKRDVKIWLDVVEAKYHVKPILYTGYKFKMDYLNDTIFHQYPYWIAHYYVNKLEYKGDWVMWQHTDCGRVSGIRGQVDCNIFNGSYEDLMDLTLKEDGFY
ncbi:MAG: glycoside hydrolase family 25 protein [Bacteroidaceae bacterium]